MRSRSSVMEDRQKRVRLSMPLLERFLLRINQKLGLAPDAVFVRFVTDAEMQRLNTKFRNKRKTTDVLSFPSEKRSRPRGLHSRARQLRGVYLGDIAISPTVARSNGKAFGRSVPEEICILMLHGVLHLLGYDHENDRGEMERTESTLRNRLGLG
jgi:probable rRNA maturation factor